MLRLDDPRWPDLPPWLVGRQGLFLRSGHPVRPGRTAAPAGPSGRSAAIHRAVALPVLGRYRLACGLRRGPYLVEIARQLSPSERFEHVFVVGLVVMCSGAYGHTPDSLPADITTAYRQVLPDALALVGETLTAPHDEVTTRYLLAAAAALKGHPTLGDVLQNLDIPAGYPNCGKPVPPRLVDP